MDFNSIMIKNKLPGSEKVACREAFATLYELQAAYPRRSFNWHTDLVSLVDCLAGDAQNITVAQKIIQERIARVSLNSQPGLLVAHFHGNIHSILISYHHPHC